MYYAYTRYVAKTQNDLYNSFAALATEGVLQIGTVRNVRYGDLKGTV